MNDVVEPQRAASGPEDRRLEEFSFTGTGREYFGIWIVNVLLTIVTLGIYSAWAKVRRQRYFYGNTRLAGRSFEYHARPMQILIGRIIVISALIVYNVLITFFPIAGLVFFGVLLLFMPWLIKRGLRFNARVTSYRNVRLDFHGGYWGAVVAFFVGPLVAGITFGIMAPHASRWHWRYMLNNLTYGGRPVASDPRLKALYGQWWLPAVMTVVGLLLVALFAAVLIFGASAVDLSGDITTAAGVSLVLASYLIVIALIIVYALAGLFYMAGVRNVVFDATVLDERHQFASRIGRRRFAWIAITNFLATLFSLGLARPWAAVRMARYIASATALNVSGSLDDYLNQVTETGPAVGAEFMDIEGFDIGF